MLGQTFANLEIIELLGIGGAAEVYRALDLRQGREVAVKVLSERAEPEMVLRFVREGRALAQLDHPHIVKVYHMGEERGQRYLVMELVAGGSLRDRLQQGKLPWAEATRIALQVAGALGCAHERQIIHRDVKPGNILFDSQGQAKLSDFGLAHLSDASTMTRTGTVMGTVLYLSPEQATGRHVDGRSDLYALGAVLYEMLTGQPPFTGPSAVSIIYKHLNEQPPKLRQIDPAIPPRLEAIVERLLHKDPDRRYGSAAELATALENVLQADESALRGETLAEESLVGSGQEDLIPFVGREKELAALHAALDKAISGLGCVVMIAGEAGLGKTRLAAEVMRAARQRNALALTGSCLYSDAPNPYAPLVEIIRAYDAQRLSAAAEDDALAAEIEAALQDLRLLLHLDGPRAQAERGWLSNLSPQDAQAQVFERVSQFVQLAARERALTILFDDLQWASPTTLQLLHYLARAVRGARVLLLGTYRREDILSGEDGETHPLAETLRRMSRERLYDEVALEPLERADLTAMLEHALGSADLEPEFVDRLHRDSEGNPFYLIETLHLWRDQGLVREGDEGWTLAPDAGEIEIPSTVADVLMRRIERAPEADRELLDWASVLGGTLDVGVLASLLGAPRLMTTKRLGALEQRHGLLRSDEGGYHIAHAKIRQVLYDRMPLPLRREVHLAIGDILEERCTGPSDPLVYDLAHHYARAGQAAKGYRYTVMAADRAEASFAPVEAAAYLEQALKLGEQTPANAERRAQQLGLRHRLAHLLATLGRQDEACSTFEAALALSQELAHRRTEAALLLDLGVARGRVGDWLAARDLGERSLALAQAIASAERQASALLSTGFFAFEQGEWEEALRRLQRASAIAQEGGLELLQARILGNMGIVHDARGEGERAIALYGQSIATFERLGLPLDQGRGLSNLGFTHYKLGAHDEARRCFEQALTLLNQVGDVREQGVAHLHLAETALAQGQHQAAREHCAQAMRRFGRIGFELGQADVDRVYAGVARREGRAAVAERYLREAIAVYQEHGDELNLAETHKELGELLAELGQGAQAREELDRSRAMFETLTRVEA